MDWNNFLDEDNIFAQNDKYILKRQLAEDKSSYFNLYKESSILAKRMKSQEFQNFFEVQWEQRECENAIYFSIFLKCTGEYAGNIVLRQLDSATPELGIDIVKKHRRQGIAYDTLKLFTELVTALCNIKYFLIRIYSDNEPSRKLFQKLGAIMIGSEPSEYQIFLNQMKKTLGEQEYEELKKKNPDMETIASKRYIVRYRL